MGFKVLLAMPCSLAQRAKRSFVAVLASLGRQWGVHIGVTRESEDADVERAFKRVARKVGKGIRGLV